MSFKRFVFWLIGKDPDAVVVSFLSGPEPLALAMLDEVRRLVPDREHFAVTTLQNISGVTCIHPDDLPGPLRRKRIGLAPTLFNPDRDWVSLRRAAFRLAPTKVLAYNAQLERHHLRLTTLIASVLFLKGVPLDRIFLRPKWLYPFKKDRSSWPVSHHVHEGRSLTQGRPRVAVLSPYFPFPLSHGGAVRIFNVLREASKQFDIFLFAFSEDPSNASAAAPVLDFCARAVIFKNPRYREPRWSTLLPPEVREFRSSHVAQTIERFRRDFNLQLLQIEYTQLASYNGDILVEHDVTFDLYDQIRKRENTLVTRWNWWRWHRYERRAVERFRKVVVMSDKDAGLLQPANIAVIPNGVDLQRFRTEPEPSGAGILFVGSFRHFPNLIAFRFFVENVWPEIVKHLPEARFSVIAGPDPHLHLPDLPNDSRIQIHGFISDVRPFYAASNLVVVPTQVSAGTNLKVLEAMACGRAIVSTTSGCAGLSLTPGETIHVADSPDGFASTCIDLLTRPDKRLSLASAGRRYVEQRFGWDRIARRQTQLWRELISGIAIRPAARADLPSIARIQSLCDSASQWDPQSYLDFDVLVAERLDAVVGFLVSRSVLDELEVLNLAVDPAHRRSGVATALLESLDSPHIFLEVRESNQIAQNLYRKLGFDIVGRRENYYEDPPETALVMRLSRIAESDKF